jgi:hypothetical protein
MKVIFLLLFGFVCTITKSQVPEFKYSQIPFGKTEEEVFALLTEAKIKEDKNVSVIDFYSCRAIKKYFEDCVYTFLGNGGFLLTEVTKKYTIESESWENIESVDLYFTKKYNSEEPYSLFIVGKKMRSEDGNLKTVANNFNGSVSKVLGKQPLIFQSTTDSPGGYTNASILLYWDLLLNKVFLVIDDIVFFRNPQFI